MPACIGRVWAKSTGTTKRREHSVCLPNSASTSTRNTGEWPVMRNAAYAGLVLSLTREEWSLIPVFGHTAISYLLKHFQDKTCLCFCGQRGRWMDNNDDCRREALKKSIFTSQEPLYSTRPGMEPGSAICSWRPDSHLRAKRMPTHSTI